jgi:phosphoesterase RecJ-like protein
MKDLKELFEYLKQPRRIVLIPHERPDGDAIGSALAMKMYLQKTGHVADVIAPDDFPDFLNWMSGSDTVFIHQKKSKTCFAVLAKADCIFFLDFTAMKRIESLGEDIKKLNHPFVSVMIDHHREPEFFTDYVLWNDNASSTAELVYEFIGLANGLEYMDEKIASCIYGGMAMDTGIFQYSNTTAKVHLVAAALMEFGINIEEIHNNVYNQYGENRMRFIGYLLSEKMVVLPENKTAYMSISMQEAERYKLNNGDKEGIVNLPLAMKNVEISVLFTEDKGKIKISFRSKGDMNIEVLARNSFNGGGHKNASGGSSKESLKDTIKRFVSLLPEYLNSQNK